jgi:hypothetical protein
LTAREYQEITSNADYRDYVENIYSNFGSELEHRDNSDANYLSSSYVEIDSPDTPKGHLAFKFNNKIKFINKQSILFTVTSKFEKIPSDRMRRFITGGKDKTLDEEIHIGDFVWVKFGKNPDICKVIDIERSIIDPRNDIEEHRLLVKRYKKSLDNTLISANERDFFVSSTQFVKIAEVKRNNVNDNTLILIK